MLPSRTKALAITVTYYRTDFSNCHSSRRARYHRVNTELKAYTVARIVKRFDKTSDALTTIAVHAFVRRSPLFYYILISGRAPLCRQGEGNNDNKFIFITSHAATRGTRQCSLIPLFTTAYNSTLLLQPPAPPPARLPRLPSPPSPPPLPPSSPFATARVFLLVPPERK
ncbi:hypothetical protein PUN28_007429 [Cardiocondyla obscurior]|uniref:Uncharacterized protein n=1 Tax=Cardiocondyla obscurior TaxID=286306 RepID=A0AAW2G929_9HYME